MKTAPKQYLKLKTESEKLCQKLIKQILSLLPPTCHYSFGRALTLPHSNRQIYGIWMSKAKILLISFKTGSFSVERIDVPIERLCTEDLFALIDRVLQH